MIHANDKWCIIEYEKGESHVASASGILVPSARTQRMMTKGKSKVIGEDADADLPDIIRAGILIDGKCRFRIGSTVLFNKHDARGFSVDDKYYYAILSELIIGGIEDEPEMSTPSVESSPKPHDILPA